MFAQLKTSATQFFASITNLKAVTPTIPQKSGEKLFIPTFESVSSVIFWVMWAVFLAFYGLAVKSSEIYSFNQACFLFADYFVNNVLIALFNIGYLHLSKNQLKQQPYAEVAKRFLTYSLVLTPIASLLANVVVMLLFNNPIEPVTLLIYSVFNMVVGVLFFGLLLFYFASQDKKIAEQYAIYQQDLLEQNERLKARITPHFFFNMLNTVQYLVEQDPIQAQNMLRSVSSLYRACFNGEYEIAFQDEIDICKHYLNIENYRFQDKLLVSWQLPEEDLLYDMTIMSLTLQLVLEKMIVFIVEMTISVTYIDVIVDWQDDWVEIQVRTSILQELSNKTKENIANNLTFNHQTQVLKNAYGEDSSLDYHYDGADFVVDIQYPLKDIAV